MDTVTTLPLRPIWAFPGTSAYVYGNVLGWDDPERRASLIKDLLPPGEAANVVTVFPPHEDNDHHGRCAIVNPLHSGDYPAEGAVLSRPRSIGITWARDCHFLVIHDGATGKVGFAHVGRDSLLQDPEPDCNGCDAGIVSNLLIGVTGIDADRSHVTAGYGGGIRAKHFTHEEEGPVLAVLRKLFPEAISEDPPYRCDLPRIIGQQLSRRRVPFSNHRLWNTCSFENSWLGSKKAEEAGIPGKENANVLVVVRE